MDTTIDAAEMAATAGDEHYSNAQDLKEVCDAWLPAAHRVQVRDVPHVLAMAQIEATLAVADELRALRLSRHLE
jgi:hypothetical protein